MSASEGTAIPFHANNKSIAPRRKVIAAMIVVFSNNIAALHETQFSTC